MQYLLRILTKSSDNFSRIYVDVVFNHMTANYPNAIGVGGTTAYTYNKQYPDVPYGPDDFNPKCTVNNYQDAANVSDTDL
jgi:alpha-amylase